MADRAPRSDENPNSDPASFLDADRYCDVVMKGGVTSGILYPPAVCELAKSYHFKSIGGTSAGAIAAVVLAAAEYRRRTARDGAGFHRLARVPEELGRDGALFALFRPDGKTKRLFGSIVKIFRRRSPLGKFLALLVRLPLTLLPPWRLSRVVKNDFGLASGMANGNRRPGEVAPLTEWLADLIDEIAGKRGAPLTFGDLWAAPDPIVIPAPLPGARGIDLRVVTTAVSHGRPYSLPFRDALFSFKPADFARIFPERIVKWMVERAPEPSDDAREEGRLPLPLPEDMPVVVAARMSLSFPGLFSMVPLYAVDYEEKDEDGHSPARRVWFSDGGVTSNFPIHFFDAPSPRWPTLAINLRYTGASGRPARGNVRDDGIYIPLRAADGIRDLWNRFDEKKSSLGKLTGFLSAILNSALDWHDNSFLRLPGYRDRVVEIWLQPREGGLNLEMPPEVIRDLVARGHAAGKVLRERFTAKATMDDEISWDGHRWTRMRSSMAAFAEMLHAMRRGYSAPLPGDRALAELMARKKGVPPKNYPFPNDAQRQAAISAMDLLIEMLGKWDEEFACKDPRHNAFCKPPRPEILMATRAPM